MARSLLPPAALASLALVTLGACSSPLPSPEAVPEEEVEARSHCADFEGAALAKIADPAAVDEVGACGHLVYRLDDQMWLHPPGGEAEAIEAVYGAVRFAPTGHLLAFERGDDQLELRDLRAGTSVLLPGVASFGFAPAPDADHGADLWTCADEILELAGPEASAEIAEGVDCASVVASSGSPRLAYADTAGRLWLADLEDPMAWGTDDSEYLSGRADEQGRDRDDRLWIDHDGRLMVHDLFYWEPFEPGEGDADIEVAIGTRVLFAGELVDSWDELHGHSQAPVRGAPTIVRGGGLLRAYVGAEVEEHAGEFSGLAADELGRVYSREGEAVVRITGAGELETLVSAPGLFDLRPSPSGAAIGLRVFTDDCLLDAQGECDRTLSSPRIWREGEGLLAAELPGLWTLLATTDAGYMVVQGRALAAGPTPEPMPPESLVLLDPELDIVASWPVAGYGFTRQTLELDDGRLILELHDDTAGGLLLVDPEAESLELVPGSVGVDHNQAWLDASGRQLSFLTRSVPDAGLFAGVL